MKIITRYNPVEEMTSRAFDWLAIDADTHEDGEPEGHGETEQEAIENLLWQILERILDVK